VIDSGQVPSAIILLFALNKGERFSSRALAGFECEGAISAEARHDKNVRGQLSGYDPRMSAFEDLLVATANVAAAGSDVLSEDTLKHWRDIVSFRPPSKVQDTFLKRGAEGDFKFNKIEDASGPKVNLDEYRVEVDRPPILRSEDPQLPDVTLSAEDVLKYVRVSFRELLEAALGKRRPIFIFQFVPDVETLDWKFQKSEPADAVGAVMRFMLGVEGTRAIPDPSRPGDLLGDWAPVLCGASDSRSWTFTTVHTPSGRDHPVSGNRRWSVEPHGDGTFTFINQGADRPTKLIDDFFFRTLVGLGMWATREIWGALQQGVADFVNGHEGRARVMPPIQLLPNWNGMESIVHTTEDWIKGT